MHGLVQFTEIGEILERKSLCIVRYIFIINGTVFHLLVIGSNRANAITSSFEVDLYYLEFSDHNTASQIFNDEKSIEELSMGFFETSSKTMSINRITQLPYR